MLGVLYGVVMFLWFFFTFRVIKNIGDSGVNKMGMWITVVILNVVALVRSF